jgi:ubiquinone/menaquinone biosynthesis C-methylase UbiE
MPSRVAANADGTPSRSLNQASGSGEGAVTGRTLSGTFGRSMSEANPPSTTRARDRERARSFAAVADAYERARPSYPDAAATWLTGGAAARGSLVLELGAGTGKLTEVLVRGGQQLVVTEPLHGMVRLLKDRLPVSPVVATAERIPMSRRSVDTVVCGQSFHWFDHDVALAEIAQVLRPGGQLAVVWNRYDTDIPWVRRFQDLIAPDFGDVDEAVAPLMETPYFGFVDKATFRFWQPHTAKTLADLTRSVSYFSTLDERRQCDLLAKVDDLYASYGRGHDGMQVPYVTHCYRAVVIHDQLPREVPVPLTKSAPDGPTEDTGPVLPQDGAPAGPPDDPGMQLIDFR